MGGDLGAQGFGEIEESGGSACAGGGGDGFTPSSDPRVLNLRYSSPMKSPT